MGYVKALLVKGFPFVMSAELLERFKKVLSEGELVLPKQTVLVAVSGGVDSVVLLHLFTRVQGERNLRLVVGHLNHGLRGREADEDQEFVEGLAGQYGLDCLSEQVDVRRFATRGKFSLEEAARIARYDFLSRAAKKVDADCVALGHSANDQTETFLDHLLRGAGLSGLGSMRVKRGIFIRPLLTFKRSEILAYAKRQGLGYREDSSNRDLRYKRNRLRHKLVPLLEEQFNPKVVDALNRASESFRECDEFLRVYASEAFREVARIHKGKIVLDIGKFLGYLSIVRKYILFEALEHAGIPRSMLRHAQISRILLLASEGRSGASLPLSNGYSVIVSGDVLVLHPRVKADLNVAVRPGQVLADDRFGWEFRSDFVDSRWMSVERGTKPTVEFIDADRIEGQLRLRSWRAGDRFWPLGLKGRKKVSDFFVDAKVPSYLRGEILILECEAGIIWVCGYRLADDFKVTEKTRRILRLQFQDNCGKQERKAEG